MTEPAFAGVKHQLIGWLLFTAALTASVAPVVIGINVFWSRLPEAPQSELLIGVYAVLFLAALITLLFGGTLAFLWLWFSYLKRLTVHERNYAEGRLAIAMNLSVMEPHYSRLRLRILGSNRTTT